MDGRKVTPLISEDAVRTRLYFTIPDAAAATGLSQELYRKLIREGELRATRIRRRWLISAADLEEWISSNGTSNVA